MKGNGDKTINVFLYMQEHEKEIYKGLIEEFVADHKDEIKEVVFEVATQNEYNTKTIANIPDPAGRHDSGRFEKGSGKAHEKAWKGAGIFPPGLYLPPLQ